MTNNLEPPQEECFLEDLFCLEPCPSDDSKPLSKRCAKPSDKYRPIPAGEHFELSWDRKLRHIVERQGVRCFELHAPPTDATLLITVGHYGQLDPAPPADALVPVIAKPLDLARWVSLQLGHEERSQDTVTLALDERASRATS
ncbi:MAG: hypothetical protein RBU37_23720 [Myxococcota bacterium]|nr:hypothetical protein [Myxococcota bacterium]